MKTLGKILRNLLLIVIVIGVIAAGFTYAMIYLATSQYPVDYVSRIEETAEQYGLDKMLVAAIIKTESDFRPEAESEVGAKGLMQLTPETAEWVCEQLHLPYEERRLEEPDYNIELGSFYLSYLIGRYQNFDLAIAAYNTGANNVDEWLQQGLITREKESLYAIPYEETREYVNRVNKAKEVYSVFYGESFPTKEQQEHKFSLAFQNWIRTVSYWFTR